MDAADSCVNAVAAAMQLPICGPGIVEYHTQDNVSNMQDVDTAAVATTSPQEKEATNHESQIFGRTSNRTIALSVNLASHSVEEVKRLIEEREGIPVSEQHLIFGGKPLRHGTFLRDYEALGDESTINVIPKIRGGSRITAGDMTLRELVEKETKEALICTNNARIQYLEVLDTRSNPMNVRPVVLTEVGWRIVHGVLTCILNAHRAGVSFRGEFGMDDLRVHVYQGETGLIMVSSVYVKTREGQVLERLGDRNQKQDYVALKKVIHDELFPDIKPMHVGSICRLLGGFTGDILLGNVDQAAARAHLLQEYEAIDDPVRRTHLLQAYAAMVSSPVAVSTMCLNLKRFYKQLADNGNNHHDLKSKFEDAMGHAQRNIELPSEIPTQPLFRKVYFYDPPIQNNTSGSVGANFSNSQYAGTDTGMEMFNFARNWFTHVPKERWPDSNTEKFEGLGHLDQIFTYHFDAFIPQALLQLYKAFHDYKLLTSVLVPLA